MLTKAWLTHYPDGVPERVDVPDISVDALLKQSATQFGEHTAIIDDGRKMTYAELDQQVDQFAAALHARGLKKGDPVLLMLPNSHEYILSYYAILRMGAIVVQVNPMYQSQELAHMISIVHPRLFIGETKQRTKLSKYNLPSIYIDGETDDLATIIHNADIHRNVTTEITPAEDVAVIQFTGGTTGVPKGAMLTHANLVANVIQTFAFAKGTLVRPGEVFLGVSPFFHVLGMSSVMNQGIYAAATIVTMRRWRVQDGVRLINEHQPTYFPAVPTMYIGLLNYAKKHPVSFGNFKVMTGGGAPMPVEVIRGVEQLTGAVISEGYGLSEASPTTHRNPYHGLRKVGSIGVPLPSTECRIVDIDTGKDAHIGEAGELLIKGPQVMKGYWGEPEATEQQLKDGWLRTGDIATVDADGYFYIVGRKKEMVIGSGYNIYPNEVEDLLYAHEHVLEVSVYGVPDPYRGETLAASVVLTEGADTTAEQLIKWCIEHLAAYKVPEIIEFRSELPKTTVGKVLRRKLVEEMVDKRK